MNTEQYPAGSYVELISLQKDGIKIVRARCALRDDGTVECTGEESLVKELTNGVSIVVPTAMTLLPSDGVSFLKVLGSKYGSPYLYATEIMRP